MAYHVNNTYAKLAPDSILNKKVKEIMRYMGGHRTSPFHASTDDLLPQYLFIEQLWLFLATFSYFSDEIAFVINAN